MIRFHGGINCDCKIEYNSADKKIKQHKSFSNYDAIVDAELIDKRLRDDYCV